jgi:predicted secreted hydrolase
MDRESLGIAGAKNLPYRVWIDDWQARQKDDIQVLTARSKKFSIQLMLHPEKPVIFQGENGFSRKGKQAANASHYYSFPRLGTTGTIKIDKICYEVKGNSWFDHEWSTSALDTDVAGWDWFSVHLDDGRDLMVCRVRNRKGLANGYGFGSISYPDGRFQTFKEDQFDITNTNHWKSPDTGKTYPSEWRIVFPGLDLNLAAAPVIPNQEHIHLFTYWEGAVRFEGRHAKGMGYVEMTGY